MRGDHHDSIVTHGRSQRQIQDFKLGGAHLKKLRRTEEGAKIFGVLRVKNHDFTPKNHIFSNLWGAPGSTPGSREFRMHMKIPAQTGSGCICFNDLKIKQAILVQFV